MQMQLVEVQVKQGLLRGQRLTPPHKDVPPFDAFLGVPYAKPPLKELRFKVTTGGELPVNRICRFLMCANFSK